MKIALVGKYTKLHDAYLSVNEALSHAGYENGAHVSIEWVDSEQLTEENIAQKLDGCDGILVPGGFGDRGIEGMILAAQYARVNNLPYFGICLGMQIAVIEFARDVLGFADANSSEFDACRIFLWNIVGCCCFLEVILPHQGQLLSHFSI